jgi:hypothetical protein
MVAPRCDQRRNYEKPLSDHSAEIGAARWRTTRAGIPTAVAF